MKKNIIIFSLILIILPLCLIFCGCSNSKNQQIIVDGKLPLSVKMVEEIEDMIANGEQLKPNIILKDNNEILKQGKDYNIVYGENKVPGLGTVYVTGCGNYRQTIIVNFNILSNLQEKIDKTSPGETIVLNQNYSGEFHLKGDIKLEILSGVKLIINNNSIISEKATLVNNGSLIINENASLNVQGGSIINNSNLIITGEILDDVITDESSNQKIENNGNLILNGGIFKAYNSFLNNEEKGKIQITFSSDFFVKNLIQLKLFNQAIIQSKITGNKIYLTSEIDLEKETYINFRNNIIDLQGYSLSNGEFYNYGIVIVGNNKNFVDSLMSAQQGSEIWLKDINIIELDNVLTIPENVVVVLYNDLNITTNNENNYIICNGKIIAKNNISLILNVENLIINSKNIYNGNTSLINSSLAGRYDWNDEEEKWEYVPQA